MRSNLFFASPAEILFCSLFISLRSKVNIRMMYSAYPLILFTRTSIFCRPSTPQYATHKLLDNLAFGSHSRSHSRIFSRLSESCSLYPTYIFFTSYMSLALEMTPGSELRRNATTEREKLIMASVVVSGSIVANGRRSLAQFVS